jgi:biopolymer transport protein ExbD
MLRRKHGNPQSMWRFNMTPLIDVTFLLLTYFMLASHYASAEKPDMDVPRPDLSQALDRKLEDKIIVNLLYRGQSNPPELTYGPVPVASVEELSSRLGELAGRNPNVQVVLRADRRLKYGQVRQVMEIIASHRLSHLQVVAELGEAP